MTFCRLGYFKYIYVLLVVGCILLALVMYSSTGKPVIADDVEELNFSAESGFYEDEFDLYIDAVGGTVFYTLDGSTPTCQSNKYTGPIHISDATNNENVYSARTDVSSSKIVLTPVTTTSSISTVGLLNICIVPPGD